MPRTTSRPPLTDTRVEKFPPRDDRYEVPDVGAPGLRLRIMPSGLKVWRWYVTSEKRVITLGPWARVPTPGHLTVDEARGRLHDLKASYRGGALPVRRDRPSRRPKDGEGTAAPGSFAAIAQEYLAHAEHALRWRTIPEVRRCVERDLIPVLGARPVTAITPPEIAEVVQKVARTSGPSMAASVHGYARGIFKFAQGRGVVTANPVAALDARALGAARGERARVLSDAEVAAFWRALDASKLPAATRAALRLLLLTGVRTAELLGARWSEVDFEARTWTVPAERQKAKPGRRVRLMPRVVPLSPQALAQLRKLQALAEDSPFVLASSLSKIGHYSKKALSHGMERLFTSGLVTMPDPRPIPHDLRRTMRTGLGDLGTPFHIAERCLGHSLGKVADVYDRSDYVAERREALAKWGAHVEKIVAARR